MELPIPGHPDYWANESGTVFSMKSGSLRRLRLFRRGRQGHLGVNLSHGGRYRMHSVHRLIAVTFLGPAPSEKHFVLHGDDDPVNNAVENLSYGLPADNSAQMVARNRQASGERNPNSKLTTEQVKQIRASLAAGESPGSVARRRRLSRRTVRDIQSNHSWRMCG